MTTDQRPFSIDHTLFWGLQALQSTILRIVLATSLAFGSYIVLGFLWEAFLNTDISDDQWVPIVLVSCVLSIILPAPIWRELKLASRTIRNTHLFGWFLVGSVLGYLALVPVVGVLAWLLVAITSPHPSDNPEATRFIVLVALWLPLWWCPSIGSVVAWVQLRRSRQVVIDETNGRPNDA